MQQPRKKNKHGIVRLSVALRPQTLWHLRRWAAMEGWGEKDIGRVIDKLVRTKCQEETNGKNL